MTWFKVDDNLAFHHKVIAAGNSAIGLWVRAGSWCAQNLTDGFVPDHMLARMGTRAQVEKLVSAGLWNRAEGGIVFHQWSIRQPLRVQVDAEREASRERMKSIRAAKKGVQKTSPQVSESRSPEVLRTADDAFATPDPTRPDPTYKDLGADKPPTTKKATQLPDDFRPAERHEVMAHELGVDLGREWPRFCDHHRAKGTTFKDWSAALNNWIRKAAEYGNGNVRHLPSGEGPNDWMRRRL